MSRDTIKDLTLMLMYLTSWEESLVPGIRKKIPGCIVLVSRVKFL